MDHARPETSHLTQHHDPFTRARGIPPQHPLWLNSPERCPHTTEAGRILHIAPEHRAVIGPCGLQDTRIETVELLNWHPVLRFDGEEDAEWTRSHGPKVAQVDEHGEPAIIPAVAIS